MPRVSTDAQWNHGRQLIKLVSFGKENKTVFYPKEDICCFNLSTLLILIDLPLETFALGTTWIYITLILFVYSAEWTGVEDSFLECLASFQQYIFQQKQNYKARAICRHWWSKIAHIWHFPINKQIFLIPACISLLFTLLELLMPHTWVHQS